MVKLVDAVDSKSTGPRALASSILASGTIDNKGLAIIGNPFLFGQEEDCAPNCARDVFKLYRLSTGSQFEVFVINNVVAFEN